MLRRVIALGVGVLLIILLLLAVRGCLNARKERGFENYASDLKSIVEQSNQLSSEFFNRLEDPPANTDPLNLEAQIASDRGSAEGLLQRVENLDVPDELAGAQTELVQAYELRRDALAGIAEDIPTALGDEGRADAINRIAEDMRAFLASDVLYARARGDIDNGLADQGISGEIPDSVFLPEPVDRWLDHLQLTTVLSTFAGTAGAANGVHGLALLSTSIGKTPLTADADNSVSLGGNPPELTVEVQNQGDQEEKEVTVSYSLSGGAVPLEGESTITKLDASGVEETTLTLDDQPEKDVPLTLEVEVLPVPGEEVADNNAATYTVTFN
jgi:CARDB